MMTSHQPDKFMLGELRRYYDKACLEPKDPQLKELFFPVDTRSVFWESDENAIDPEIPSRPQWTDRYYAIVDRERRHLFTIVSASYLLITNLEAYRVAHAIANTLFKKPDENETFGFVPFRTWINKNRSTCEISIVRKIDGYQPELNDGWVTGIVMQNSYNKSKALTYYIGFFNERHKLSLILPENSISFKLKKSKYDDILYQIFEQLSEQRNITKINKVEQAFRMKLEDLKNTPMDGNMFLAFFCKFFGISRKGVEREGGIHSALSKRDFINERKQLYIEKYGQNAYAFLLGISDYIDNYEEVRLGNSYMNYHIQAGQWADEYLKEVAKPNFSLYKYIGEDAMDTAWWLNTLGSRKL
jgi:hypothetical protein